MQNLATLGEYFLQFRTVFLKLFHLADP